MRLGLVVAAGVAITGIVAVCELLGGPFGSQLDKRLLLTVITGLMVVVSATLFGLLVAIGVL